MKCTLMRSTTDSAMAALHFELAYYCSVSHNIFCCCGKMNGVFLQFTSGVVTK